MRELEPLKYICSVRMGNRIYESELSMEPEKILARLLGEVEALRHARGVRYRFCNLRLMCIYAVLSGYCEATDIEHYVELNFEYFRNLIGQKEVMSNDTFPRILRFTDFERLSRSLAGWLNKRFFDICWRYLEMKVLPVDGKAGRTVSEKSRGEK